MCSSPPECSPDPPSWGRCSRGCCGHRSQGRWSGCSPPACDRCAPALSLRCRCARVRRGRGRRPWSAMVRTEPTWSQRWGRRASVRTAVRRQATTARRTCSIGTFSPSSSQRSAGSYALQLRAVRARSPLTRRSPSAPVRSLQLSNPNPYFGATQGPLWRYKQPAGQHPHLAGIRVTGETRRGRPVSGGGGGGEVTRRRRVAGCDWAGGRPTVEQSRNLRARCSSRVSLARATSQTRSRQGCRGRRRRRRAAGRQWGSEGPEAGQSRHLCVRCSSRVSRLCSHGGAGSYRSRGGGVEAAGAMARPRRD